MKRIKLNEDPIDKVKASLDTISNYYNPLIKHVLDDTRYKSNLAKFNMMRATFHLGFDYESCVSRWLRELAQVQGFHEDAELTFPDNPISQSIYFVAHVQYLLLYKKINDETPELLCPYDLIGGANFIVSLVETNIQKMGRTTKMISRLWLAGFWNFNWRPLHPG